MKEQIDYKGLATVIHENAKNKGFYDNVENKDVFIKHQLLEIFKEYAEFHEAFKKGKTTDRSWHVFPAKEIGVQEFQTYVKDTYQDELADIVIRCLDLMMYLNYDINNEYFNEAMKIDIDMEDNYQLSNIVYDVIVFSSVSKGHESKLNVFMFNAISIAKGLLVNLKWHIEAKMQYNFSRERLHGKKF